MVDFSSTYSYLKKELDLKLLPISKGKRGRTVEKVQQWLQLHDCYTSIDGMYGPATQRCVELFQNSNNLPVTGKVDQNTWQALIEPLQLALNKPWHQKPTSFAEAVLLTANHHLLQSPMELGAQNIGPWVRIYCEGNDGIAWPWCAGFVSLIIKQAAYYMGMQQPLRGSVSCDVLAAQAQQAGLFVSGNDVVKNRITWPGTEPAKAAIFLRKKSHNDWDHTGFVSHLNQAGKASYFFTVEGNTDSNGGREGIKACCKVRSTVTNNYDFIVFN